LQPAPQQAVAVDSAAAAGRLAAAVRLPTISSATDANASAEAFRGLHQLIETSFPKLHAKLRRELVGSFGLLYTWPGSDAKAKPIALLAHQDVVPIAPGTEKDCQQPPFAGVIDGGFIWGRGAWDNKGNLMSQLEAVELLVASGFEPRQTIYLFFGQDEEVSGHRGAEVLAKRFQAEGIHPEFMLDEGTVIAEGILKGLDRPAALVGMAEKGYVTIDLTATATPGHSSMPPPEHGKSAIAMLSKTLVDLDRKQFPVELHRRRRHHPRQPRPTLRTPQPPEEHGAGATLTRRWLPQPQLPSAAAMLRTTSANAPPTSAVRDSTRRAKRHRSPTRT